MDAVHEGVDKAVSIEDVLIFLDKNANLVYLLFIFLDFWLLGRA